MAKENEKATYIDEAKADNLEYVESMLAQLRSISEQTEEFFLSYLIELAMQEAGSLKRIARGEAIAVPGDVTADDLADAYLSGTIDDLIR